MTESERFAIKRAAKKISNLAGMRHVRFSDIEEQDAAIKNTIATYMQRFEAIAMLLEDLYTADVSGNRCGKQRAIDEITRRCT